MTSINSYYRSFCLVVMVVVAAIHAGGCSRITKGSLKEPSEHSIWKPFDLRPGDYFKYAITDHTQAKEGWITVRVIQKGHPRLEARWEGELGGQQLSVTTVAPADRLIELSRPMLITSQPAVPFAATILSFWWDHVSGFQWRVGARWSVVFQEMIPIGFTLQVEDRCEASRVSGFYGRVIAGSNILGEVCVSPPVPLPLWVLTKDTQGNPRYEARLTEYAPLR